MTYFKIGNADGQTTAEYWTLKAARAAWVAAGCEAGCWITQYHGIDLIRTHNTEA